MSAFSGRSVAAFPSRALLRRFSALAAFVLLSQIIFFLASSRPACAVVVRGVVTDSLSKPVAGARVQLVQGGKAVAETNSGVDGSFQIQSTESGRFLLLTSAAPFYPGVGEAFYGGSSDVLTQNVVLEGASVHQDVTVMATGLPTPVEQTGAAVTSIPEKDLATTVGVVSALRQSVGVAVVQQGQAGGIASLFVRGGNSTANHVLIDGITGNDVGGIFDFGTVSSTGLIGLELYRGPNSALYGTDAGASVVNLATPRGSSAKPVLNYSGDGGNFYTYRNEAALSGAHRRLDYFGAFSYFATSNALPRDKYHSATSVLNLGYSLTANTLARFTLRNADSATGLPSAHDFYGISANGKQSDQDLYSGLTLENRLESGWHNLVRYGIARKREQGVQLGNVGTPITYDFGGGFKFTEYFGNVVTIRGANGYTATGQASFFVPNESQASNRDEVYYQSDYSLNHYLSALGVRLPLRRMSFAAVLSLISPTRSFSRPTMNTRCSCKGRSRAACFIPLAEA